MSSIVDRRVKEAENADDAYRSARIKRTEEYHAVAMHVIDKILMHSCTRLNESELQSFNQFVNIGIPNIVAPVRLRKHRHEDKLYGIVYRKGTISKPQIEELNGTVHKLYIGDARYRDASYMAKIGEWVDLYVVSKRHPLDQEEETSGSTENLQNRTASKAKRVRVELMENVMIHQLVKKKKRMLEAQNAGDEAGMASATHDMQVENDVDECTVDTTLLLSQIRHRCAQDRASPLMRNINGRMLYDWTQDPSYTAKYEEAAALLNLSEKEREEYKYLVHFEHLPNHKLWEMPIPDDSVACHSHDNLLRSQDTLPNKGGKYIVSGKVKTMMRTPRLKYDFPFLFVDPKSGLILTVRSSHPFNKYRSTGTLSLRFQKRNKYTAEHMTWDLPYAEEKYNVAFVALFRALGWMQDADIEAAILFQIAHYFTDDRHHAIPWIKLRKYITDSIQFEASKCQTQEDAWFYIGEHLKSDDNHRYNSYHNNRAADAVVVERRAALLQNAEALAQVLEGVSTVPVDLAEAVTVRAVIMAMEPPPTTTPTQARGTKRKADSQDTTVAPETVESDPFPNPLANAKLAAWEQNQKRDVLHRIEKTRAGEAATTKEVLPHIGYSRDAFLEKGMFLAHCAAKYLLGKVGVVRPDLRDNVKNKRYMPSGEIISTSTRKKHAFAAKLVQTNMVNALHNNHPLNLSTLLDHVALSKNIHTTYATGKLDSGGPPAGGGRGGGEGAPAVAANNNKAVREKTGVCQNQNMTNISAIFSQQQRIAGNLSAGGGQVQARLISGDWGVVDFVETPEGAGCGIIKPHTLFARCSIHTAPSNSLSRLLNKQETIIPTEDIVSNIQRYWAEWQERQRTGVAIGSDRLIMVMNNGRIPGMIASGHVDALIKRLREVRYSFFGDTFLSIVQPNELNQVQLLTDAGRLLAPLFVADKFEELFPFLGIHLRKSLKKKDIEDAQDDMKRARDVKQLSALIDHLPWDHLLKEGFIEYIDNEERDSAVVAMDPEDYYRRSDKRWGGIKFTHLEILPTLIFGVCASQIPFPEHNQAPRNTYQSNMGKQGMASMDTSTQTETTMHVLTYPSKPWVHTMTLKWLRSEQHSSGTQVRSLIACYHGFNQEDAVILNQASLDRGLFQSFQITTVTLQAKKRGSMNTIEQFCKPSRKNCLGMKTGSYVKLDHDGFLFPGTPVNTGDVIIGRKLPINKTSPTANVHIEKVPDAQYEEMNAMCTSISATAKTTGIVLQTLVTTDVSGMKKVKTKIQKCCNPIRGDKFASRHAQKGVNGMTYAAKDMPWDENGQQPDIIINPHGIPSRMTAGHLVEMLYTQVLGQTRKRGNVTAFTHAYAQAMDLAELHADDIASSGAALGNPDLSKLDINDRIETMARFLRAKGQNQYGNKRMYHAKTGKLMGGDSHKGEGQMFQGFIWYQKLVHLAHDKIHSRARGPRHILSKQPVEGGRYHGGYRLGEMERLVLIAYGASELLGERHRDLSDSCDATICEFCGYPAQANIADELPWCAFCKSSKYVRTVPTVHSWSFFYRTLLSTAFWPRYMLRTLKQPGEEEIAEEGDVVAPPMEVC